MRSFLTCLTLIIALATSPASADYWASCDGCGSNARNFALGVPPDQPGFATVNVYDSAIGQLSAFSIMIYYDYEFRGWMRTARPVQPSLEALESIQIIKDATSFFADLSELVDPINVDIPSAQVFLLGRGAYDRQISEQLFGSMQAEGLWDRFVNASAAVGSAAARAIGKSELSPKFRVTFEDGSSVLITTYFLANDYGTTQIKYLEGSARLADGTTLPDSTSQINGFTLGTNNPQTAHAVVNWIGLIAPGITMRRVPARSGPVTHLFQCTKDECILTVVTIDK
ncbi:MAG: hypothetical protein AB8F65_12115 [Woeseiaceae bacterium]